MLHSEMTHPIHMMHILKILLKNKRKLKIRMKFMDLVKKLLKKILQCQAVLKFQGRNPFLDLMKKNKLLKKNKFMKIKRVKNNKKDILIIQYPKHYQNMKNHSRNYFYNKWWTLTYHFQNIKVYNQTINQSRNKIHFLKNSRSDKKMNIKVFRINLMQ